MQKVLQTLRFTKRVITFRSPITIWTTITSKSITLKLLRKSIGLSFKDNKLNTRSKSKHSTWTKSTNKCIESKILLKNKELENWRPKNSRECRLTTKKWRDNNIFMSKGTIKGKSMMISNMPTWIILKQTIWQPKKQGSKERHLDQDQIQLATRQDNNSKSNKLIAMYVTKNLAESIKI
jgi:hypothetical protein